MKRIVPLILVLTSLVIFASQSSAVVKSGVACSPKGKTQSVGNLKYTCVLVGKKLVWNSGVKVPQIPVVTNTTVSLSVLTGQQNGKVTGNPKLPAGWALVSGYYIGPGANLKDANLSGANLYGLNLDAADLTRTNFTSAKLGNVSFNDSIMSGTILTNADMSGSVLSGINAVMSGEIKSGGITGNQTPSLPATWKLLGGYLIGPAMNLSGADFTNIDLSNVNCTKCDLTNTKFPSLQVTSAKFDFADLSGTELAATNFVSTSFLGAKLTNLTFSGVLAKVSFQAADLTGANLSTANFASISSGAIIGIPLVPNSWTLRAGFLLGPSSDLSNTDLSGIDLSNLNMNSANLSNSLLSGTNISNTNLANSVLKGIRSSKLIGSPISLPASWGIANGYLVGPGADLTNANLKGANLTGISLCGATLTGVISGGITAVSTANLCATLISGYLLGIQGQNLSGADFSNVDFLPYVLKGVDLFTGNNLTNANFSGARLYYVSFANTDLSGANLSNSILTNANFTSATLINVNLSGANLTGATFTGVKSGGVIGTPATLPNGFALVNGVFYG